ncbi:unnamed protein product [Pleuronectes platessa]|uniref:Uncharacterized protein n=1 Tax=Pleuronectes platessa TaxID=8262 RepID=A0A9N7W3S9_PLEPL|nr:unnamed protein product [Pleuronectes platessa]
MSKRWNAARKRGVRGNHAIADRTRVCNGLRVHVELSALTGRSATYLHSLSSQAETHRSSLKAISREDRPAGRGHSLRSGSGSIIFIIIIIIIQAYCYSHSVFGC